jgi:hypothetical protein
MNNGLNKMYQTLIDCEKQLDSIRDTLARVRVQLKQALYDPTEPPPHRRKVDAAAKRKMSAAQKKRWTNKAKAL